MNAQFDNWVTRTDACDDSGPDPRVERAFDRIQTDADWLAEAMRDHYSDLDADEKLTLAREIVGPNDGGAHRRDLRNAFWHLAELVEGAAV